MLSIRRTEPACFKYVIDYCQDNFGISLPKGDAKNISDVRRQALRAGFFETDEPQAGDILVIQRYVEIHFGVFLDQERFTHSSYGKVKVSQLEAIKRTTAEWTIFAHPLLRREACV